MELVCVLRTERYNDAQLLVQIVATTSQGRLAWRSDCVKTKKQHPPSHADREGAALFERLELCLKKPLVRVACFAEYETSDASCFSSAS